MLLLLASPAGAPTSVTYASEAFTGTTGAAWPSQWTTFLAGTGSSATIQANAGRLTSSTTAYTNGVTAYLNAVSAANMDVVFDLSYASPTVEQYTTIFLRASAPTSGTDVIQNGYGLQIYPATGLKPIGVIKHVAGVETSLTPADQAVSVAFQSGVAKRFRFQVIGTAIRVKTWDPAGTEPTAWLWEGADSALTAAGRMTLTQSTGASGANTQATFDNITLTNGVVATDFTASPALSGAGTLAGPGTLAVTPAAALGGVGTLAGGVPIPAFATTVDLTGAGTLTGPGTPKPTVTAALSTSGTLTATAGPNLPSPAALTGSGVLTTAGAPALQRSAGLSGAGTLAAAPTVSVSGVGTLGGAGVLTVGAAAAVPGVAALGGSGTLTGVVTPKPVAAASLSGSGALTAAAAPSTATTVSLSGGGALASSGSPAVSRPANLSGAGTLTANAAPALSRTASFTGAGTVTATGTPSTSVVLPFTDTFTGTDGSPWSVAWTARSGTATVQSNTGELVPASGSYAASRSDLTGMSVVGDTDITGTVLMPSVGVEQYAVISIDSDGDGTTDTPTNGYCLILDYVASHITIRTSVGGATADFWSPAKTLTGGVTYSFRFQRIGQVLAARVWTGVEPTVWDVTYTIAGVPFTGVVGLAACNGNDGVPRAAQYDNVIVSVPVSAFVGAPSLGGSGALIGGVTPSFAGVVALTGSGALTAAGVYHTLPLFTETFTAADGSSWPSGWVHRNGASVIEGGAGQQTPPAADYAVGRDDLTSVQVTGDWEITAQITAPTGGEQYAALAVGDAGIDNIMGFSPCYLAPTNGVGVELWWGDNDPASGLVSLDWFRGGDDNWTDTQIPYPFTAGTYNVRLIRTGSSLSTTIWPVGTTEPSTPTLTAVIPDGTLTEGFVTLGSQSGISYVPTLGWDDLRIFADAPTAFSATPSFSGEGSLATGQSFFVRTNLFLNPALGSDNGGWYGAWANASQVSERDFTTPGALSGHSYHVVSNASTLSGIELSIPGTVTGATYTISVYVKADSLSPNFGFQLWGTSNGSPAGMAPTSVGAVPGWQRYTSGPVQASAGSQLWVDIFSAFGDAFWVSNPLYEQTDTLGDYFDGTFASPEGTSAWAGTVDASPSVESLPVGAVAVAAFPAFSGSGGLAASAVPSSSGIAALSGSGSLATSAAVMAGASIGLGGTGALSAGIGVDARAAVALTGSGSLTAVGTPRISGTAPVLVQETWDQPDGSAWGPQWSHIGSWAGQTVSIPPTVVGGQGRIFTGTGSPFAYSAGIAELDQPFADFDMRLDITFPDDGVVEKYFDFATVVDSAAGRFGEYPNNTVRCEIGLFEGTWTICLLLREGGNDSNVTGFPEVPYVAGETWTARFRRTGPHFAATFWPTGGPEADWIVETDYGNVPATGGIDLIAVAGGDDAQTWVDVDNLIITDSPRPIVAFGGSGSLLSSTSLASTTAAGFSGTGILAAASIGNILAPVAFTGSGALIAAGNPAPRTSVSLGGVGALTAAAVGAATATVALTSAGVLQSSTATDRSEIPTFTGSGTLSASGVPSMVGFAAFSATAALSAATSLAVAVAAALGGAGVLAASASSAIVAAAALSGTGVLAAVATGRVAVVAAFTGAGVLAANPSLAPTDHPSFTGTGVLTASVNAQTGALVSLSSTGSLVASTRAGQTDVLLLSGSGTLSAATTFGYRTAAAFTGSAILAAAPAANIVATDSLGGTGALDAGSTVASVQTPRFAGSGALTAAAIRSTSDYIQFSGSGALAAGGAAQVYRHAHFGILEVHNSSLDVAVVGRGRAPVGHGGLFSATGHGRNLGVSSRGNPSPIRIG